MRALRDVFRAAWKEVIWAWRRWWRDPCPGCNSQQRAEWESCSDYDRRMYSMGRVVRCQTCRGLGWTTKVP